MSTTVNVTCTAVTLDPGSDESIGGKFYEYQFTDTDNEVYFFVKSKNPSLCVPGNSGTVVINVGPP